MNAPTSLWQRWLLVVTLGTLLFGLALVLLPGQMQVFFNLVIFGQQTHPESFSPEAIDYITFVCGVLGAVMVGWAVSLLTQLLGPIGAGERPAWWWGFVLSVVIWFVVDSTFSVVSGYWRNAVLNTVFFIGFLIPLAATARIRPQAAGLRTRDARAQS